MLEEELSILREWSLNFRSFTTFKKRVEENKPSRERMQAFAQLLAPYQMNGSIARKRFARQFFDTYITVLAGSCGCSRFIPDHRRVEVLYPSVEIALFIASYRQGVFDCSASQLIQVIDVAFDTGCCPVTLERMFYEGTPLSDYFIEEIKKVKVGKSCRKRRLK